MDLTFHSAAAEQVPRPGVWDTEIGSKKDSLMTETAKSGGTRSFTDVFRAELRDIHERRILTERPPLSGQIDDASPSTSHER